jgi:hypothetical protein
VSSSNTSRICSFANTTITTITATNPDPATTETESEPTATEMDEDPTATETDEEPTATETDNKPTATDTDEEPTVTKTESEPTATETESEPTGTNSESNTTTSHISTAASPTPASTKSKEASMVSSATSRITTTASTTSVTSASEEASKISSAPQASSTAKKGNCPTGKILDPAEGGQDGNTKDPKCAVDDGSKCSNGKKAARRWPDVADRVNWTPGCGTDDEKDFECKDPNTYGHREIKMGEIQHSCRSTRKSRQNKQNSYNAKSKNGSSDKNNKNKAREQERQKKAKRIRSALCFIVLSAVNAPDFANNIVNAMSQDEIDGLNGIWADDSVPAPLEEGNIRDFNIKFTPVVQYVGAGVTGEEAGMGGLVSALARIFGRVGDNAAADAGKAGSAAGKASGSFGKYAGNNVAKELESGSRAAPAAKAIEAAKSSSRVTNMLKSQRFKDSLTSTAGAAASDIIDAAIPKKAAKFDGDLGTYEVDWSLSPYYKIHAVPDDQPDRTISVELIVDKDYNGSEWWLKLYYDSYKRDDRLYYEDCTTLRKTCAVRPAL